MTTTDITQKTIQSYNKQASAYAERWFDFSLNEELDKFTAYLKPGGLILDVGSGAGRDMRDLRRRGYSVIGLDRSAGMLKEAA
ncbi:MAG TPA: methyltransferase domain-containing protein, partial [Chloroflexi bacterium]|nr:methyltransferase domain-containing protein [Chloroflexota bacterium]